jgi:hypothetical protein
VKAFTPRDGLLVDLVRAEEQGIDLNRLLFARQLVRTARLNEGWDMLQPEAPTVTASGGSTLPAAA